MTPEEAMLELQYLAEHVLEEGYKERVEELIEIIMRGGIIADEEIS